MTPKSPTLKRRNGLAAFRAVEPEVRAALSAGWTLLAIYEEKRSRLGMSYAQFARYAKPLRTIAKAERVAEQVAAAQPRVQSKAPSRSQVAAGIRTGPPKGRPEDAVPTLNMDGFATQVLKNKDLF